MTEKDIEKMLNESEGLDMSHINQDDILAKARQELYFATPNTEPLPKAKKSFFSHFTGKRIVPIVAGLACAFTLFIGGVGLYNENYQTIYIDVNPSVALKLNRFDRVVEVEYLNDDAKNLLSNVDLKGCDVEEALETVLSKCDAAGFVREDSEIYISATSKEEESSEKLLSKLKGKAESMKGDDPEKKYTVSTYNTKEEEKEKFEKSKISPAKDKMIHEIVDIDDDYDDDDYEELKGKSMYELSHMKKNPHKHDKDDDDDRDDKKEDDDRDEINDDHDDDDDRDEKPEQGKDEGDKGGQHKEENDRDDKDNKNDKEDDDEDDEDDDRDEGGKNNESMNKNPANKPSEESSNKKPVNESMEKPMNKPSDDDDDDRDDEHIEDDDDDEDEDEHEKDERPKGNGAKNG